MTWWLFFYKKNEKSRKCHDFRGIDPLQGVQCKSIKTKRCKMSAENVVKWRKIVKRRNAGVVI